MRAERLVARGLGSLDAYPRLEPLPLGVDQGKRRHRYPEQAAGQPHYPVEHRLGGRIEQVERVQQGQARVFIGWQGSGGHGTGRLSF